MDAKLGSARFTTCPLRPLLPACNARKLMVATASALPCWATSKLPTSLITLGSTLNENEPTPLALVAVVASRTALSNVTSSWNVSSRWLPVLTRTSAANTAPTASGATAGPAALPKSTSPVAGFRLQ